MITLGEFLQLSIDMRLLGQIVTNVWTYHVVGLDAPTNATTLAARYWDVVRTSFRALVPNSVTDAFRTIRVRSLSSATGAFGEFPIPPADQAGTRVVTGEGSQLMPPFVAAGVRLSVATRTTRPGQKRIPFVTEGDHQAGHLLSGFQLLVNNLMSAQVGDVVLTPNPGNTVTLRTVVIRMGAGNVIAAHQNVTGFLISPIVTTQNTRKIGRGV